MCQETCYCDATHEVAAINDAARMTMMPKRIMTNIGQKIKESAFTLSTCLSVIVSCSISCTMSFLLSLLLHMAQKWFFFFTDQKKQPCLAAKTCQLN